MGSHATTIRRNLNRLIENQIARQGCKSLFEFNQRHPDKELFDEPLCPFANRLCPTDLCYLPAGHVGTEQGYHITGTTAYDDAFKWHFGKTDMQEVGMTRRELIQKGADIQALDERLQ